MKVSGIVAGIIAIAVLIVLSNAVYIVDETQQVIITQFGKPVGEPKKRTRSTMAAIAAPPIWKIFIIASLRSGRPGRAGAGPLRSPRRP